MEIATHVSVCVYQIYRKTRVTHVKDTCLLMEIATHVSVCVYQIYRKTRVTHVKDTCYQ
jgi:hypothetical protein